MITICCIAFMGPGVPADETALRNLAEPNPDYHGYALITPGGNLITEKSPDSGHLIAKFVLMREIFPDGPAVWHSRLSTGSVVTEDNGHPLICGPETVVAHNGALPFVLDPPDGYSDTRWFAEAVFPAAFADLDDPATFALLETWSGPGNKLAFLTTNERYQEQAYLTRRDQWLLSPDGVLYSNADALGKGTGWDELVTGDGELHRWNVLQPGQCTICHLYGCDCVPGVTPAKVAHPLPRYRNETQRLALVAGASR